MCDATAELLLVADVIVHDVLDALDLITNPLRLKATLRD
jgi:soluble P-type ATPase